ncbi:Disintegrin and metalloproteinase domain-containing protein 29 [Frankliniella fusca]|uniref:Disintegrin and metalloproteinase domain-containing protein 29 n=1 Tax=Frankliniella fusca TaxID=407009 RepID=A0AAE1HYJ7_9NEOP|nr:Disintegrin and metalloproteinase domain-containing protein 29 [Frankliniella fusca]
MADDKRRMAYAAFSNINQTLEQRRRIPALERNVPYLMTKVVPLAVHKEYGQGYQVHLRDAEKKKFFVILPRRIVQKVGIASFEQLNRDIAGKQPPCFIFKGLDGNAFDVVIKPFSLDIVRLALKGEPLIEAKPVEDPEVDSFDWLDEAVEGQPGPSTSKSQPEEGPSTSKSQPEEGPLTGKSQPEEGPSTSKSQPEEGQSSSKSQPEEGPLTGKSQPEAVSTCSSEPEASETQDLSADDGDIAFEGGEGILNKIKCEDV